MDGSLRHILQIQIYSGRQKYCTATCVIIFIAAELEVFGFISWYSRQIIGREVQNYIGKQLNYVMELRLIGRSNDLTSGVQFFCRGPTDKK